MGSGGMFTSDQQLREMTDLAEQTIIENNQLKAQLASARAAMEAATPWVTPLIAAIREELGGFGPHTPAEIRRLKQDRDAWKARAIKAQEEHVARLAAEAVSKGDRP